MKNACKLLTGSVVLLLQAIAMQAQSGIILNQQYVNGQGGGTQTYLIATTAADGDGDYDHLHLIATFNCDDYSNCNSTIDATFGNRGGFTGMYTVRGAGTEDGDVRIVAYRQTNGTTNIYLVLDDYWDVATYSFLENTQDTVYPSPVDSGNATPTGTLVFDTSSPSYPPQNFANLQGDFVSSGRVGIGTNSPVGTLSVASPDIGHQFSLTSWSNAFSVFGSNSGNPNGAALGMGYSTTDDAANIISAQPGVTWKPLNFGGSSFSFYSEGGNIGISQSPSGSVGIGTTSPLAKLDVNGTIKVAGQGVIFPDGSIQSSAFNNQASGGGSASITQSNGNVGIGTASPVSALTVLSNATGLNGEVLALQHTGPGDVGLSFQQTSIDSFGIVQRSGVGNGLAFVENYYEGFAGTEVMRILGNGRVGIGTASPTAQLEVNGNVKLTQGSGASITFADGTVQNTAYVGTLCPIVDLVMPNRTIVAQGGDYAESVDISGDKTSYEPGDVMVIDSSSPERFVKSSIPYSTLVAGIYSTKPGYIGRRQTSVPKMANSEIPMAMVGIVPTKVTTENGPIEVGDLLVTSSTVGYAMKGSDKTSMSGAIVGKALARMDTGKGVIEVLVTLQ